ncbi:MAG: GNAT family N-acetyltransferase [Kordiimonadaceae bacterium]|mgnify:CR=1 FL=1|jgi:GNAT superfamily N-acetyltransferase|nr:GNAT family N-acetyltransferase [Kordiimonadaceae bacterium]MBT6032035.1 GNAT family N-acetyltransferase [Kordiimonadaceae bacterium]
MNIREATDGDRSFIFGLSPTLIERAKLHWHTDQVLSKFQNRYITESLDNTEGKQIILIAEKDGVALEFIQVIESKDEISEEICSRIPLLAVSKEAQGAGVGRRLMNEAEAWAKKQGHRLLQLEVFNNNDQARAFYEKNGFENDTIIMVKPLND